MNAPPTISCFCVAQATLALQQKTVSGSLKVILRFLGCLKTSNASFCEAKILFGETIPQAMVGFDTCLINIGGT